MAAGRLPRVLSWAVIVPVLAIVLLPVTWGHKIPALLEVVVALALAGAVLAAVNHAEIVALVALELHRWHETRCLPQ